MRRRWIILFAGCVARVKDTRDHQVKVCDVWRTTGGGCRQLGGAGKQVNGVSRGRPQSFCIMANHQRTTAVQQHRTRRNGARRRKKGRNFCFMAKWIPAEKARARQRDAVICPNVTGRMNERIIAQIKHAYASSIAIVD